MKQINMYIVGLLVALGMTGGTSVQAAETAVDINQFSMEITSTDVTYSEDKGTGYYTLAMDLEEQNGYLFGLYRQDLNWEGQAGTTLTLYNDSNDSLLLMLQLIDEDWQGIVLPDGTAVLLQEDGETGYTVVFASGGTIVVPAQFSGHVMIPHDTTSDDLSNLKGFGLTFIPLDESVLTIWDFTFWNEEVSQLSQSLQGVNLHLQDSFLCIPQTGEAMTVATTTGLGDEKDVVYTLVNPPLGATIDDDGRIIIDSTVTVAELVVRATVDQQLVLKTTLFLYTVWDSMPADMALEDFTILDPSYYSNQGHYSLIEQLSSHVYLLRIFCAGTGVVLLSSYVFWRRGSKKP